MVPVPNREHISIQNYLVLTVTSAEHYSSGIFYRPHSVSPKPIMLSSGPDKIMRTTLFEVDETQAQVMLLFFVITNQLLIELENW